MHLLTTSPVTFCPCTIIFNPSSIPCGYGWKAQVIDTGKLEQTPHHTYPGDHCFGKTINSARFLFSTLLLGAEMPVDAYSAEDIPLLGQSAPCVSFLYGTQPCLLGLTRINFEVEWPHTHQR